MAKYKLLVLLVLLSFVAKAQVYTPMTAWGYAMKRVKADSTLHIPSFCGVPTLRSSTAKDGAIAMDTCNNKLYKWTNAIGWSEITGGSSIDTTRFVKYTDTTSMLVPYLRKVDTTSMLVPYLRKVDTTAMLVPYLRKVDTISMLVPYLRKVDTTSMLVPYLRKVDTTAMLTPYLRKVDTTAMLTPYLRKVDTTNKFVSDVTKLNDSTITIFKGSTQTNITLSPSTTVASATRLITQVYNNSGSTISKGSVIYINGRHSSNLPTIALAQANTEANSYSTFALVQDDIPTSNSGVVIQAGTITNLNLPTSTYTDGQMVYLSPTVAGGITTTKPLAPYHIVKIGTITRAHPTFGTIELKIENGWQLDELSDVKIALVPIDSTILQFSRVDSLWHDVNPTTAMGNRFVKRTDSAAMLTPYLRKTDTASLSNRINLKLSISDTSTMLTPYLRKIDTASLSSRINLKLSISDTSTMLSKYLRKTDTASLSSRIDAKLAITDTSVFQRKSLASYTFMANNTTATANATAQTFKDSGLKVYNGTITFTPVAPSGATNNTYRWSQIGKLVTVRINLLYATASGATLSQLVASLPSDCPAPEIPTGFSGANTTICPAFGYLFTSSTASPTTLAATIGFLRSNSGNNGYEIVLIRAGGSVAAAYITLTYFAQ